MRIGIWPHNVANNGIDLYRQLAGYINKTDTIVENSLDCDAALIWSVLWYGRMAGNHKVWQHYRKQNKRRKNHPITKGKERAFKRGSPSCKK